MKQFKLILLFGALILGWGVNSSAQDLLPEVTVSSVKYKYLSAVDHKDIAQPVKLLERRAAEFDVRNSEFYDDDYDEYSITFYLPQGYVLATYDKSGKLLRTAEKFKDIALPTTVAKAIVTRYPQWKITKDVYLITYNDEKGANKTWKILLENGDKRLRIKTNEKGEFL